MQRVLALRRPGQHIDGSTQSRNPSVPEGQRVAMESAGVTLSYVHRGATQDLVVALGTNGSTPSNELVTLSALLE